MPTVWRQFDVNTMTQVFWSCCEPFEHAFWELGFLCCFLTILTYMAIPNKSSCMLPKTNFCLNVFPHCSQLDCFSIVWNIMSLSTSTLVALYFPHSLHLVLKFSKWLFVNTMSKFNVLCHGCFQSRHVMTIFPLGPLAFKYPENMLV